jgi:hypothetical protein
MVGRLGDLLGAFDHVVNAPLPVLLPLIDPHRHFIVPSARIHFLLLLFLLLLLTIHLQLGGQFLFFFSSDVIETLLA